MSAWTNTHYYDGKIASESMRSLKPLLIEASKVSKEEKIRELEVLWTRLNTVGLVKYPLQYLIGARAYFDVIVSSIGHVSNYDPTNDVRADDVLYLCIGLATSSEHFCIMLLEQLKDIGNGVCSQGRCTRVIQLLVAYMYASLPPRG